MRTCVAFAVAFGLQNRKVKSHGVGRLKVLPHSHNTQHTLHTLNTVLLTPNILTACTRTYKGLSLTLRLASWQTGSPRKRATSSASPLLCTTTHHHHCAPSQSSHTAPTMSSGMSIEWVLPLVVIGSLSCDPPFPRTHTRISPLHPPPPSLPPISPLQLLGWKI